MQITQIGKLKIFFLISSMMTILNLADSARILGLFPFQGKSHFIMYEKLMLALAAKGHSVLVVSHFPQKENFPRYTDLSLKGTLVDVTSNVSMSLIESSNTILGAKYIMDASGVELCEIILDSPQMRKLRDKKHEFDLIVAEIFGGDCMLPFKDHFKVPLVGIISSSILPWATDRFGIPDNPSYIPNYFLNLGNEMNFFERFLNTVFTLTTKWGYYHFSTNPVEKISRNFFGPKMRSFYELEKDINFLLLNSHYSINGARPMPPNVAEVGGLHVIDSPVGKLSEKWEKIVSSSQDGIILFSLGSMVQTETMRNETKIALFEALKKFPTYTILWKGDPEYYHYFTSDNIIFEKWIPQLEILCNPKTKLFITHGGLMGSQEAIYCGVPMLGMPLFADQNCNIHTFIRLGIAEYLNYYSMDPQTTFNLVDKILNSQNYTDNMKRVSQVFRERPLSPISTAIFWIEHVIKYSGATHLRPASLNLPWYKLHLIDVSFSLILLCLITFILLLVLLKIFITFLSKSKKNKDKHE